MNVKKRRQTQGLLRCLLTRFGALPFPAETKSPPIRFQRRSEGLNV